jgi:predicted permease
MRLFRPKPSDTEMDEELRAHFEMRLDRNIADGMSPEEARRAAQKQFGWIESLKEDCRDARRGRWFEDFRRDIAYAVRSLRKNPAFTLVVIATLAVGTGANTAVFSLVNAALLRPLPFREPDRLVWISNPEPASAGVPGMTRSVTVRDWRERSHSFERFGCYIAWFGRQQTVLSLNGESFRVEGAFIDREFLPTLGVSPQIGREFAADDILNSALLTHRFWKTRFNANPAIVGTAMTISGRSWTIVGVLPESFDFSSIFAPGPKPIDFLRPAPRFGDLSDNSHAVIGRLKPGVTLSQAQAELDGINAQIRNANPDRGSFGARLVPLREHVSGDFRLSFAILSATVVCVLLIACANLCNLLLARAATRRQEWAVRMALGAGRSRLLRQMLAESFLLSFAGAAAGLFLAHTTTNGIVHSRVFFIPLLSTAHVDRPALIFTITAAGIMAVILGVVPALQLSKITLRNDLKEASRGLSEGTSHASLRSFLIVAEVAVACVLLVGAGLLIHSFVHITKVDLGFKPDLTFACRVRTNRDFKTNTESIVYFNELSQRIHALPGVEAVAFTRALPLGSREIVNVRPKGATYRPEEAPAAFIQDGDPGFFQTLRIPLISGRHFNLNDTMFDASVASGAIPSVMVNEKLARDLWPNENAAGQTLFVFENANAASALTECKVVGVVGNVRHSPLEITAAPQI